MDELKQDDKILTAARDRMRECRDVEDPQIEQAAEDLRFLTGEGQWPESERAARDAEGKPTLTFNALPQFVRKITGQIRQINPAIKVGAADSAASDDVAEIYEGLIREIEYRCDAPSIYESAAESAASCGIGHFRIRTDYYDHEGFDQHILIERVFNPFAVFYDPKAKEPTRQDAEFAFIIEQMRLDDFKDAYPDADTSDFADARQPSWWSDWRGGETITIAEYYWREFEEYEIAVTEMGQVIKGPFPKELRLARKRTVRKPNIMWAKVTGSDILEGPTRVVGEYIPVIAVTGEEIHIGEKVYRSGAIRHAKDSQVSYNIMRTASVETTLLQPRAPYLVTPKQISGLETFWNEANNANRPYLPYNPDDKSTGIPARATPPVASTGLLQEAQVAAEDMKRTIGIYDASLGARSNETSGVAIQSRQKEAEIANSIYADNMVKAVSQAGRVIVSMIPEIYDAKRIIRVLGEDAQEKLVEINQMMISQDGIVTQNDMKAGRYAVRVSVGPTYDSKRQEASAGMMDLMQRIPQAAPIIADLVAGSQEWPDADRIAERLRKTIPPNLLEDDEKTKDDPQAQMMAQQQSQQAQQQAQMQQAAQQAEIEKKMADASKAKADAQKAEIEAQEAAVRLQLLIRQMNAAQFAPMPTQQANQGPMPY